MLPLFVSSSQFAFLTLIIGLALWVFAVRAWRGVRIDNHELCRRCGYDLSGAERPFQKCSECGSDVSSERERKIGNRQRRRGRAMLWGLLGLVMFGPTGIKVYETDWNGYKPVWYLTFEVTHPSWSFDQEAALNELRRRSAAFKMDIETVDGVILAMLPRMEAEAKAKNWAFREAFYDIYDRHPATMKRETAYFDYLMEASFNRRLWSRWKESEKLCLYLIDDEMDHDVLRQFAVRALDERENPIAPVVDVDTLVSGIVITHKRGLLDEADKQRFAKGLMDYTFEVKAYVEDGKRWMYYRLGKRGMMEDPAHVWVMPNEKDENKLRYKEMFEPVGRLGYKLTGCYIDDQYHPVLDGNPNWSEEEKEYNRILFQGSSSWTGQRTKLRGIPLEVGKKQRLRVVFDVSYSFGEDESLRIDVQEESAEMLVDFTEGLPEIEVVYDAEIAERLKKALYFPHRDLQYKHGEERKKLEKELPQVIEVMTEDLRSYSGRPVERREHIGHAFAYRMLVEVDEKEYDINRDYASESGGDGNHHFSPVKNLPAKLVGKRATVILRPNVKYAQRQMFTDKILGDEIRIDDVLLMKYEKDEE
ncbi:hypothetical protein [Poriferisphaera sp. WC338]|uniref:hypothetical protein n=1 Tax=Poriferisphaera sp. WC338 TaxID=3425129 RepID=UPI003D8185CE